jgi:AraC-like DNA-binding protein
MLDQIRYHSFPLSGIEAMTARTSRVYPRHTHDQYGIGVVDYGGHASDSDRGRYQAGPGSLICLNPGEIHDGRPIGGQARAWRMLYFDPELMHSLRAEILEKPSALTFTSPVFCDEPLRQLLNIAFPAGGPMACETTILRIAARIQINCSSPPSGTGPTLACIRRARDRIDSDPSGRHTLADLAAEAGISRYQLVRAFARELRLTPHAYIVQQRLALARRLIRHGCPLSDAATGAGFFDQSHLTRSFARQFGVSPDKYASAFR